MGFSGEGGWGGVAMWHLRYLKSPSGGWQNPRNLGLKYDAIKSKTNNYNVLRYKWVIKSREWIKNKEAIFELFFEYGGCFGKKKGACVCKSAKNDKQLVSVLETKRCEYFCSSFFSEWVFCEIYRVNVTKSAFMKSWKTISYDIYLESIILKDPDTLPCGSPLRKQRGQTGSGWSHWHPRFVYTEKRRIVGEETESTCWYLCECILILTCNFRLLVQERLLRGVWICTLTSNFSMSRCSAICGRLTKFWHLYTGTRLSTPEQPDPRCVPKHSSLVSC